MSSNDNKKGIIFYDNWCELVNRYYDAGDTDAAYALAFAIVRLYSTGELIKLPRPDLDWMLELTIQRGIETQIEHYENGKKGGAPRKLTDADQPIIAKMRADRKTAKEIAKHFAVSDDTVSRSNGWKHWQDYIDEPQNTAKLNRKTQNQEKEEEEEEYKEKEKSSGSRPVKEIIGTLEWDIKTAEEQKDLLGF